MGMLDVHTENKNVHGLSISRYYTYLFDIQCLSMLSILSIKYIYYQQIYKNRTYFLIRFIWK
jgi:hypothetical protein